MSTYVLWLKSLLKQHKKRGLTQKKLAAYVGLHQSAVTNILKNDREIGVIELQKIAEFFDVPVPSINSVYPIDIIGKIGAGGHIETRWETGEIPLFRVHCSIEFLKYAVVGYQISGDSMNPQYEDGDIVIVKKDGDDLMSLLNKDAVVFIEEEGRFLKKLMPGAKPGLFNLYSYNAPLMLDKPVAWASKVRSVLKSGDYDVAAFDADRGY